MRQEITCATIMVPIEGPYTTQRLYHRPFRNGRSGSQANMAAWDLGMGLRQAASCGADTTDWIAGVKAEINELDKGDGTNTGGYDVIGLGWRSVRPGFCA